MELGAGGMCPTERGRRPRAPGAPRSLVTPTPSPPTGPVTCPEARPPAMHVPVSACDTMRVPVSRRLSRPRPVVGPRGVICPCVPPIAGRPEGRPTSVCQGLAPWQVFPAMGNALPWDARKLSTEIPRGGVPSAL